MGGNTHQDPHWHNLRLGILSRLLDILVCIQKVDLYACNRDVVLKPDSGLPYSATYNNANVGATLYVNPTGFCVQGQNQGSTCGANNTPPLYAAPTPPAIVGTLLAGQALTQVGCPKGLAMRAQALKPGCACLRLPQLAT